MKYEDYKNLEFCKNKMDGKSTKYDRAQIAALYVLQSDYENTCGNPSGPDIWNYSQKHFGDIHDSSGVSIFDENQKDTFLQYLSKLVRDPKSPINSKGQRRGFFIDLTKVTPSNEDTEQKFVTSSTDEIKETDKFQDYQDELPAKTRINREAMLYPVLQSWLVANQYQAADISSGKLGGKWGNPDVAGISVIENFQGISIEIATIEAKTSSKDWEKLIFEAVSHRRFSNRSYFAYAEKESVRFTFPDAIKYYADLYKIGVLMLILEDTKYNELLNGTSLKPYSSEDIEIVEICSAPFNFVQPRYQVDFCKNLGITSAKEIYLWGKADD